jgi:hypothetical protein
MRLANQAPPISRGRAAGDAPVLMSGIRPADCPNGMLYVQPPNGAPQYAFPGVVGCCWSLLSGCNPCEPNSSVYGTFVQQNVPQCAGSALSTCQWWAEC